MKTNKKRRIFSKKKPNAIGRWIRRLLYTILTLVIVAVLSVYFILNSSLPTYSGTIALSGLEQPVIINRDHLGTVEIIAENRSDLAFSLGFTHAQERYFQMDLLRRSAAGELSELFGSATIDTDKRVRRHRFRSRAEQIIKRLPEQQIKLLNDYTQGVNKGLTQLSTSPFEYWLLNAEPLPWRIEDTVLVVYAMYLDLQPSTIERERVLEKAFVALPESTYQKLIPAGSDFDAPLDNSPVIFHRTNSNASETPLKESSSESSSEATNPVENSIEGKTGTESDADKETENSNTKPVATSDNTEEQEQEQEQEHNDAFPGSNNFAVSGNKSNTGSAIVAGDMHLGLAVPNIWFKANMHYNTSSDGNKVSLYGVTLPGTPLLIAGTNNHIAWAFTNSYGDYNDVFAVQVVPDDRSHYIYQGNIYPFKYHQEMIRVKGQPSIPFEVQETMFGPVIERDASTAYSLLWVAHQPDAINLNLLQLETVKKVQDAMDVANRSAIPAQNFVVGDRSGDLGWTIIGPLPARNSSPSPVSTIYQDMGQVQWLKPEQYPRIYNPEPQALWTANNRIVGGDNLLKIGDGGYANGVRALAIKNQLLPLEKADEKALLNVQLSTDAPLYRAWQDHLLTLLRAKSNPSDVEQQVRALIASWNGRSDKNQAGFTILKKYRGKLSAQLLNPLAKKLSSDAKYSFRFYSKQYEALLWQIIKEQPAEYLPEEYSSYKTLFESTLNDIIAELTAENQVVSDQIWGNYNRLNIQHPISRAVPMLGHWLDRPNYAMPGDVSSPRVQTPTFGASQRFVISPGHIDSAIYHMPGGQSGHPMSEYYDAGFIDWVEGRPTPLKIQDVKHSLRLTPN